MFGVILPLGLLAQLRRPERRIAGIQQTALVAIALGLAGAAGEAWWYLVLAGGVAVAFALLVALHPARRTLLARGRLEPATLTLAAVAAAPLLLYAWRMARAQRRELPPADAVSNGLHHWTMMAAVAVAVLLLVLLAALGTSGAAIPAISASIAVGAWAISCQLAPVAAAGSEGHAWAWVALAWAVVTLVAAASARTRDQAVTAEARLQAT
jgi:hypothetical protein